MEKVIIVAEMGSSWLFNKDPKRMIQRGLALIEYCAMSGANAIKTQWVSDSKKMAKRRKLTGDPYDYLNWPIEWHGILRDFAEQNGVKYFCTTFLKEDVPLLEPFNDMMKVASLENGDRDLIEACLNTGKEVLVSTGCTPSLDKIPYRYNVRLLHCTAAYPCPIEQANLGALYDCNFYGFSDHTNLVLSGALAAFAGANLIEVHVRLADTPPDNPDYKHSHGLSSLSAYVAQIRLAERLRGNGEKKVEPGEKALLKHRVGR